uniref:BED-type domain-containing protein n=1 Tax=Paramormyrops kingsleyae TaxID=1676925 RepID=A0A3B3T3J7_9TELE
MAGLDKKSVNENIRNTPTEPKFTSAVWKQFSLVVDKNGDRLNFAACNFCKEVYPYSADFGTSGLRNHKCSQLRRAAASSHSMTKFFDKKPSSADKVKFKESCAFFVASDIRPYNIVAGPGFAQLIQTAIDIGASRGKIDASELIPDRRTVGRCTSELANRALEKLSKLLDNNDFSNGGVITADMWSDDYRKLSYMAVTAHFSDGDWVLHDRILGVRHYTLEDKSAENIRSSIKSILSDFKIDNLSHLVIVTDRGSNMIAAFPTEHRISCSAHLLNSTLTNTFKPKKLEKDPMLKEVFLLLTTCKDVVKYAKQSGIMEKFNPALCQISATIRQNKETLLQLAADGICSDLIPAISFDLIDSLIGLLTPFKDASDQLESSKKPTLHNVLPHYRILMEFLMPNFTDSQIISRLKNTAKEYLQNKFEIDSFHCMAVFLNPKMRSLKPLDPVQREGTMQDIRDLVASVFVTSMDSNHDIVTLPGHGEHAYSSTNATVSKRRRLGTGMGVRLLESFEDDEFDTEEAVQDEIHKYKTMNVPSEKDFDLLSWWKENASTLPRLSQIARRILAIPATSAPSERAFSAAGLVVDKLRTQIGPKKVNDLIFLPKGTHTSETNGNFDNNQAQLVKTTLNKALRIFLL